MEVKSHLGEFRQIVQACKAVDWRASFKALIYNRAFIVLAGVALYVLFLQHGFAADEGLQKLYDDVMAFLGNPYLGRFGFALLLLLGVMRIIAGAPLWYPAIYFILAFVVLNLRNIVEGTIP